MTSLLTSLDWDSLEQRRKIARLTMLYKISNKHAEVETTSLQHTGARRSTRRDNTRNYTVEHSRTDVRKYSFFPRTIREWNALPLEIVLADSVEAFKAKVSKQLAC